MLWFLFCFCGSSDGFQRLRNRKYFIFRFDDHHHNKIVAISVIGCVIRMNGVPPRAARGEYKSCVLLLEEPGIHLHHAGHRDLLELFEELAGPNGADKAGADNTIIYTT